jgi:hypothetical protein
MTTEEIKKHLISAGVKNLKEFGYPDVNAENILTDLIYSQFFAEMLNSNIGSSEKIDKAINQLLEQIAP